MTLYVPRYIIVQNADFGLVVKGTGSADLLLANVLYWLFISVLVIFASISMPVSQMIDNVGQYPDDLIFGKICLQRKIPVKEEMTRNRPESDVRQGLNFSKSHISATTEFLTASPSIDARHLIC